MTTVPTIWRLGNHIKAFYHIDLHPAVWECFGFVFVCRNKTYYGHYIILPFGLATAPWIQTKLMRVLVSRWRVLGLHMFVFIDDGLAACRLEEEAKYFSPVVKGNLEKAGVLEQPVKSIWKPRQVLTWLGLKIDLA